MTLNYVDLKAAIAAETDPTFVALRDSGQSNGMAEWYNVKTTTDAWSDSMSAKDMDEASDYASFDTVVAGKRDAWGLFLQYSPRDMSKNKNRKVVTDVWGNATAASVSEAILQASLVKASRAEMALGTNSATTGTVTGVKRNWVGTLTFSDIDKALKA